MWIRSQNNYILANVNSFRICKGDIDGCIYYSIHGHYDRYEQELGEYSTKEKALKVLDEINSLLDATEFDVSNLPIVFEMPLDEEVEL